jgi:branched-chain amino acid transport system substrate-binding protein
MIPGYFNLLNFKLKVFVVLVFCGLLNAQNFNTDINKDFEKAVSLFKANNYQTALAVFQRIAKQNDNNSKLTASEFFIAKIYLEEKNYDELDKAVKNFLNNFSSSKYADEIKKISIQSYIDRENYLTAFRYAVSFIDKSNSIVFWNDIKVIAEKIALNYLSSSDVKVITKDLENSNVKPFLLLVTAKLLKEEGDPKSAENLVNEILDNYKNSDESIEALNLKKNLKDVNHNVNTPLVGVVLSLTDQNGIKIQSVNEILEGIKFAFHENNSTTNAKIGLLINDIHRDKQTTIESADAIVANDNVRCILGPVFSDDVRNVLKEIDHSNICVISPTATDDDLVKLSENFYQANPSFTARGKDIAQYLYYVENARKIVVLNSVDGYSPLLAEGFIKEFKNLGGNIVINETYKSDNYALSDQMSRISTFAPSVDGIYAPLSSPNDAKVILSSMVQLALNLKIYGSQDWFIAKGFETSPELSNKLVFESDYYIDYGDKQFQDFSSKYKKQTGKEVNRNVLYGYDLAKYIITVMNNTDPTRKNIKYKMESGINVKGFHNNISFDAGRINKFINIVRFKDGIFELVERFRSGD